MEKRKLALERLYQYIMVIIVVIIPFLVFVMECAMPDREESVLESKTLMDNPIKNMSFETYLNGEIFDDIENYISEQLPCRDELMQLYTDTNLGLGRTYLNKVILTEEGHYLDINKNISQSKVNKYIEKVEKLNSSLKEDELPFLVVVAPSKQCILDKNTFPVGDWDVESYEKDIYTFVNELKEKNVDAIYLKDELKQLYDAGVSPFYYTDHHWNSEGCYEGYKAIINHSFELGLVEDKALEKDEFATYVDPNRFRGSRLRKFGGTLFRDSESDVIVQYLPAGGRFSIESEKFEDKTGTAEEVFIFPDKYEGENDKYLNYYNDILFSYAANPVLINEDYKDGPVLVLLADSYSQPLAPMMIEHYSKIYLIDVRKYEAGIAQFAKNVEADIVMVFFSELEENRFENLNP